MNKIEKTAVLKSTETTESDIKLINEYALKELKVDDVFTFKLGLCDNEVDRDFECFPLKTLKKLSKLFVGKTIIKDHRASSDNQIARIFKTELVEGDNETTTGERYTQLIGYCYILRSATNETLIADIEGGIKSECSVSCAVKAAVCSICSSTTWCEHWRGEIYEDKMCYRTLEDAVDAYEVSLVAVPAQPASGVKKSYEEPDTAQTETEPQAEQTKAVEEDTTETEKMFIELNELYILNEKRKEVNN